MDYEKYYREQARTGRVRGGGYYSGRPRMKGYGIGLVLARLGRFILPILKPVAKRAVKAIGRQALKTGSEIALDAVSGVPIKQALTENAKKGVHSLIKKAVKREAPPRKPHRIKKRRKVKVKVKDIFSK